MKLVSTYWVPGALSLGIKQPRHEADHSHPSSAEVKNKWNSTPPYIFMAWCLIKQEISLHGMVRLRTGTTLPLPMMVTICVT